MTELLSNYVSGQWQNGKGAGPALHDPVLGTELVRADASGLDLAAAFAYARHNGGAALRALTDKWDAIGKVPKERSGELDRRLRAVEKKVRDAGDSARVDPEALARAEQFRTRAEQFERQAEKAAAAGRTKEADEAKANATQWREWADAAAKAVAGKR